jgi:hypothetical protein
VARKKGHVGVELVPIVEGAHADVKPEAPVSHSNALQVNAGITRAIAQNNLLRQSWNVDPRIRLARDAVLVRV